MPPLIDLSNTEGGVSADEIRNYRVLLEVPLREAAEATGLSLVEYGQLERGVVFLKDANQWRKLRALLKNVRLESGA